MSRTVVPLVEPIERDELSLSWVLHGMTLGDPDRATLVGMNAVLTSQIVRVHE